MNDTNSLAHTKWNCKYHIVFAPKYRQSIFWRKAQRDRENTAAVVRMEKGDNCRGGGVSGSYSHAS